MRFTFDLFLGLLSNIEVVFPYWFYSLFSFFADFEQYWQREKHHHYISSPGGHDLPFCWSQWVLHWPKAIVEIVFHQQLLKATATPITSAAAAAAEPTTIISIIAKNIFSSLRPSGDTGRGKPIRGLSPSENQRLDFLWRKNLASCNATFARAFITLKSAPCHIESNDNENKSV